MTGLVEDMLLLARLDRERPIELGLPQREHVGAGQRFTDSTRRPVTDWIAARRDLRIENSRRHRRERSFAHGVLHAGGLSCSGIRGPGSGIRWSLLVASAFRRKANHRTSKSIRRTAVAVCRLCSESASFALISST